MQVTFLGPIQSVKGSLDKNSGAYFTTRCQVPLRKVCYRHLTAINGKNRQAKGSFVKARLPNVVTLHRQSRKT